MKKVLPIAILFCCALLLQSCKDNTDDTIAQNESNNSSTKTYQNPVFDHDFADPTVIKAADGKYYAYATNSLVGNTETHIQVLQSDDLVHWKHLGDAMPSKPTWASTDFWAPHVSYDEKLQTYFLYYSGESNDDKTGKCLGVATSKSPSGPFIDKGTPLISGEGFVNIDPMAIDDKITNKKLLFWGSGFQAIKVQELADDRISFKQGTESVDLVLPITGVNEVNYSNLVEGAWITKHDDYYYLFYSGDNCCGDQAHYAVMVARSKNATGPYEKYTGKVNNVILEKSQKWIAPGHNSIVTDANNQDWIVYHAIDNTNKNKGRVMLIDKVNYINGWPQIKNGMPSETEQEAPITLKK
nr:glycoside hydrolase family 43 protein [uncultured Flavobacterium sp.]